MKDTIKILLIKKKSNISQLADILGMSRQNLHNKLNRNYVRIGLLKEIADVLDVELEIKFKLKEKKPDYTTWRSE